MEGFFGFIHGIPSLNKLAEGDIVGVDVGINHNGFYGDTAKTFSVGKVSEDTNRLLKVSELALSEVIRICFAGCRVGDISSMIQKIAEKNGFNKSDTAT